MFRVMLLLVASLAFLEHLSRSLGTLSHALSKSTKAKNRSLCTSRCFSCSCCMINTASGVSVHELNPNCSLLTVITFLSLRSRIFSNIFILCSSSLKPLKFPHSSGSPFICIYGPSHFSLTLLASVPLPKLSSVFHASRQLHSPIGVSLGLSEGLHILQLFPSSLSV